MTHLVQIDEVTEFGEVSKSISRGERREIKLEVGAEGSVDGLKNTLSFDTVNDLKVCRVVPGNGGTGLTLLHDVRSDASGDIGGVGKAIHATVEIGPDGFNLRDAEEERVHQTEDIECHPLHREGPDGVRLELLGNQASCTHQTSAAGPPRR